MSDKPRNSARKIDRDYYRFIGKSEDALFSLQAITMKERERQARDDVRDIVDFDRLRSDY